MDPTSAHRTVAISMILTGLTVALAQDWIGHVREWVSEKASGTAPTGGSFQSGTTGRLPTQTGGILDILGLLPGFKVPARLGP